MKKIFVALTALASINAWANSTPIEPVLIPITNKAESVDIQMGKYEVTVEEFLRFANATNYVGPEKCFLFSKNHLPSEGAGTWRHKDIVGNPFMPIGCVGVNGAKAYAKWLSKTTGKPYRLPEFNEWLYATSGGNASRFSFGDDLNHSEMCDYENIEDAANLAGMKLHHNYRYNYSADCNDGAIYQTVVGMYRPNAFGLHDMIGNVRETLQTCKITDKENPEQCLQYTVVGSGWHWVPRPSDIEDSLPPHFVGSIEGFRVVLDSNKVSPVSTATKAFIADLAKAQNEAKKQHDQLKKLPERISGVTAKPTFSNTNKNTNKDTIKNTQVKLTWAASTADNVSYTIYRSYLDSKGKVSREMTKVAEGIKDNNYLDTLPGSGAASYQLFAVNNMGESLPSDEVFIGSHQVFSVNQRVEAEHYQHYRNAYVIGKDQQFSSVFTPNKRHYPPTSALIPFEPAWQTYRFDSKHTGDARLTMSIRGEQGAQFEVWQGNHMVAKATFEGAKDFVEMTTQARLIKSDEPLQIRHANKKYFIVDWFELSLTKA